MTFERGRHEAWEELISAAVTGDLIAEEKRRLEAHVAGCTSCRSTWDAFADGRRVVGGLRHYAPPRDLGARVRAGVESGAFSRTPWWRRGPAIFAGLGGGLAVVAGALLALVMLDDSQPPVGQATPTPIASLAPSASLAPETQPPAASPSQAAETPAPTPGFTLPPTPGPSQEPDPDATPTPVPTQPPALASSPEPDVIMAVTGPSDNQALTLREGTSGETIGEPEAPPDAPIAAAMTDDGEWLAYVTETGLSGMQAIRVTHLQRPGEPGGEEPITIEETIVLSEDAISGGPFLDRLEWSRDGRYLAFTVWDAETGTDAWVYDTTLDEARQLTSTGTAYAASWLPREEDVTTSRLWVSVAGETPMSYLLEIEDDSLADLEPVDPAEAAVAEAENVFQPLLSPNGALVIYWTGQMEDRDGQWLFTVGGAPMLAEHRTDESGAPSIEHERTLFGDVTIDQDAFTSAAIAWGPDGDTIAVWQAEWTGLPQVAEGAYPDPAQVYFGRATEPGGLTAAKAIDAEDLPDDGFVIDVKIAPTGRHLLITVAYPVEGDLAVRTADLLLVEVLQDDRDIVERVNGDAEGWFGPAAFSAPDPDSSQAP